jgi:hypothetical protein
MAQRCLSSGLALAITSFPSGYLSTHLCVLVTRSPGLPFAATKEEPALDFEACEQTCTRYGGSSGIGAAIARAVGRQGARVVVHGRDRERAERVCQSIRDQDGGAWIVVGDRSLRLRFVVASSAALSSVLGALGPPSVMAAQRSPAPHRVRGKRGASSSPSAA